MLKLRVGLEYNAEQLVLVFVAIAIAGAPPLLLARRRSNDRALVGERRGALRNRQLLHQNAERAAPNAYAKSP